MSTIAVASHIESAAISIASSAAVQPATTPAWRPGGQVTGWRRQAGKRCSHALAPSSPAAASVPPADGDASRSFHQPNWSVLQLCRSANARIDMPLAFHPATRSDRISSFSLLVIGTSEKREVSTEPGVT
jgi:hypothetical protein